MPRRNNLTECLARISRTIQKHIESMKTKEQELFPTSMPAVALRGKLVGYLQCKNIVDSLLKREQNKPKPSGKNTNANK